MAVQIFIWWIVIQLVGLAALPLTGWLFRALPDGGYAFGKSVGLLLTGYLAWLLAMLGLAPFGPATLVVCALGVFALGWFVQRRPTTDHRPPTTDQLRTTDDGRLLRWNSVPGWRAVLGYEALFLAALVFLALLRSHDTGFVGPNPWGTERPMDFALFNAIQRSAVFPPHDPWLAGYSINYYYFGYLLMASMGLLTRLEPSVAYNLSLALIFALTALGVAGLVVNLVGLTAGQHDITATQAASDVTRTRGLRHGFGTAAAALLAVALVLFAGNQGAVAQLITGTNMALALEGPDLGRAIVNGAGPRNPLYLDPPFKGWDFDGTRVITPTPALEITRNFGDIRYWWAPSRALWDNYPDLGDPAGRPIRRYAITEFPFFSFWLGDMHPHVMALPFGVLALALALQTVARRSAPAFARGWRGWVELGLNGVLLGSLYTINSWDFPTYVLLYAGALLLLFVRIGARSQEPGARSQEPGARSQEPGARSQEPGARSQDVGAPESGGGAPRVVTPAAGEPEPRGAGNLFGNMPWRAYLIQLLLVCAAAVVLFLPFHLTFRSLVGGKEPLVHLPVLATITRTLGLVTWDKTGLHTLAIIFGLFLVPLIMYVFAQGSGVTEEQRNRRTGEQGSRGAGEQGSRGAGEQGSRVHSRPLLVTWSKWMPLIALTTVLAGEVLGFPLLVLLLLAVYAALLALERAEQPAIALTLWAFALGCLICFGAELIYIRDTFESRMNTIFKFYYQLWLIWGVLAAYAVWWLFAGRTTNDERRTTNDERRRGSNGRWSLVAGRWSLVVMGLLFGLLLAGGLAYPWLTASAAFRQTTPTGLQGKTPRQSTPAGVAAIEWLRRNTAGDAVVLEAVGPNASDAYDTGGLGIGGVSASTGLATVLGWAGHQQQWRGGDPQARAQIEPRRLDVTAIYSGTLDAGKARELLDRYGVDYIYVGAAEQASYPAEGLARLAELGTPVFQQDEVTIYRVER